MQFFDWAIDQIPRVRRDTTGNYGVDTLRRIARILPERPVIEQVGIMRGYFRHRLLNRLLYRFAMHATAGAAAAARMVPITGRAHITRMNKHPGPIIIAAGHFGSLYFQCFIVERLLQGRRIYMMHERKFADAKRDEAFLRKRGIIPVGADTRGLRTMVRALEDGVRTAIVLPFDAPMGERHAIDFLSTRIPVSTGLGFLADVGNCPIVPWFWQIEGGRPSIVVETPVTVDPTLLSAARRIQIVETLYALLERRVAKFPEQWHLDFLRDATVRARRTFARVP